DADLLWFPTGGGKTEAYLGVAAFAMAIRRLQGDLGGYDGSRGLTVIMRYTLRLLTLQQFQRATALLCAMEVLRRRALEDESIGLGKAPFTIGLWVGNRVTPGKTADSDKAIRDIRTGNSRGGSTPAQLTSCPWCGSDINPGSHIDVDTYQKRTEIYCGDALQECEFSKGQSSKQIHPGLPVVVVDEEIYCRPPSMMIATVDKFAALTWRGSARTLFGRVKEECDRHGLLWPEAECKGNHPADRERDLARAVTRTVLSIRPPDLIIQDEFHLISGPLGTMVGLYESAIDELASWGLDGKTIKPKVIASTATVRKAQEQIHSVFLRQVCIFPPHGLDIEDNFFSVQRPIASRPGRRYLGVCSPGSARPAVLIRMYATLLTASQALLDRFGNAADPYMTCVGYFNSLRELGGMRRLAEDDVQTRAYRVQMSSVDRPALNQRSVNQIRELTSRVSSQDIPKYLDELETRFEAQFDSAEQKFVVPTGPEVPRGVDVVLATNMLSVGVDVSRLGLMVVNGQPKGTAEYIQATSRAGRQSPGLILTVLTWARPRDLSHYETFEHYHATFYKHVEAQSVTPFSPRAMDRGLTGALISVMRQEKDAFNPNDGAASLDRPNHPDMVHAADVLSDRAWQIKGTQAKNLADRLLASRA
ncbi:MAG: DISARM system helicase DrmA, partial [Alphaproteobacteria bacterium]|nr:DISARM system helicase DrmA [Alphaproteobacteria bacterium]